MHADQLDQLAVWLEAGQAPLQEFANQKGVQALGVNVAGPQVQKQIDAAVSRLVDSRIPRYFTGNGAAIGGLKVITRNGWFAARPSGTEDVYKIYAESFKGPDHLAQVQDEARAVVAAALGG